MSYQGKHKLAFDVITAVHTGLKVLFNFRVSHIPLILWYVMNIPWTSAMPKEECLLK